MEHSGRRAFALLALVGSTTLAGTLHRLPTRVATHFDAGGVPNAWSSHAGYILVLATFGLLLPLAVVGLVAWLSRVRPAWLNVPARDHWLLPQHRAEGQRRIMSHMWWLACLMAGLTLGIHLLLLKAHQATPPRLPTGLFLAVVGTFLGGVGVWIGTFVVVLRPTPSAGTAVLIAVLAAISGCAGRPAGLEPRPSHSPPEYSLAVRVLPDDRRIEVAGTVRLAARDTSHSGIPLSLSNHMGELRVQVLEPSACADVAKVERVEGSSGNARWIVHPPRPCRPGQSMLLRCWYAGDGEITNMYYIGPEAAFASAWGTEWYPLVEGDFGRGTAELSVSVPPGWTVATGGPRRSTDDDEARVRSAILDPDFEVLRWTREYRAAADSVRSAQGPGR